MHEGRAGVLAADGVESETQQRTLGVDDDLLVLDVDRHHLADDAADGDDLGARLQVLAEVLALLLLLLGLAGLPPHHGDQGDKDDDHKHDIHEKTPYRYRRATPVHCPKLRF